MATRLIAKCVCLPVLRLFAYFKDLAKLKLLLGSFALTRVCAQIRTQMFPELSDARGTPKTPKTK